MKALRYVIVLLIVVALGVGIWWFVANKPPRTQTGDTGVSVTATQTLASSSKWEEVGVAIAGTYADADVVAIGDGTYRMYYSIEPEVPNNKLEMYSATSSDGATWKQDAGTRATFKTFPDVVKLADGTWRMYFQNDNVIKSATSKDGLAWTDEQGVRIDKTNSLNLTFENIAASSTMLQSDGTYIMVYRGLINTRYNAQVPNSNTELFLWATSKDGLTWEKKGLAVDSRNATLEGLADGADLVAWDKGVTKLFFWSYRGVYEATFSNGTFSTPQLVFQGSNADPKAVYSPNPPSDPTVIKIGQTWNMFYGQHTKGIYRATLK